MQCAVMDQLVIKLDTGLDIIRVTPFDLWYTRLQGLSREKVSQYMIHSS